MNKKIHEMPTTLNSGKKQIQNQESIGNVREKRSESRKPVIQKILEEHYDDGETPYHISQITGINLKTVSTYFKEFNESFSESFGESTETDFLNRMVVTKEFALYRLDTVIDNLEKERLNIEKMIELEPDRPIWHGWILKIISMMVKIELVKFQLQANPRFSPWFYRNNNHTNWTVGLWPTRIKF